RVLTCTSVERQVPRGDTIGVVADEVEHDLRSLHPVDVPHERPFVRERRTPPGQPVETLLESEELLHLTRDRPAILAPQDSDLHVRTPGERGDHLVVPLAQSAPIEDRKSTV